MDIKTRRVKLRLSQAQLAKKCGVSQAYICSLESEYIQTPNQEILARIDNKLDELLKEKEPNKQKI